MKSTFVLLKLLMFQLFLSTIAFSQGIVNISPISGNSGETVNATIVLDPNVTPPLPPADVQPTAVAIGNYAATSFNRTSNTEISATFNLPENAISGNYDVTVTFSPPVKEDLILLLPNGFEIFGNPLTIFFVDGILGNDVNDGLSWTNAKKTIQAASDAASLVGGGEIWVKQGIYKPTLETDREISFEIGENVKLYGGFAGTETLLSERDYLNNSTILSGDIGVVNDNSDNSYHIIVTSKNSLIDGFGITGGNADGDRLFRCGGGIYMADDKADVANCSFINNNAEEGGAIYVFNINGATSSTNDIVNIDHCSFSNNSANNGGAIVLRVGASANITNSEFLNNSSEWRGGAIFIDYGAYETSPINIETCNFSGNSTNGNGGAIYSDDMASQLQGTYWFVSGCNFSNNSAVFRGGAVSNYNTNNFPNFNGNNFSNNTAGTGGNAIANDKGVSITANDNNFDIGQVLDNDEESSCTGNNCP